MDELGSIGERAATSPALQHVVAAALQLIHTVQHQHEGLPPELPARRLPGLQPQQLVHVVGQGGGGAWRGGRALHFRSRRLGIEKRRGKKDHHTCCGSLCRIIKCMA